MPYLDILAVYKRGSGEVLEVVTLERDRYPDVEAMREARHRQTDALKSRYRLPSADLDLFTGSAKSLASFFEWFRELKRTADTRATCGDDVLLQLSEVVRCLAAPPNKRLKPTAEDLPGHRDFWFDGGAATSHTGGGTEYEFANGVRALVTWKLRESGDPEHGLTCVHITMPGGGKWLVDEQRGGEL